MLINLKISYVYFLSYLFVLKLAVFSQSTEIYLHNVYYLKLSLIALIYFTFTDFKSKKELFESKNVRNL